MNILVSNVGELYTSEWISELLNNFKIDQCTVMILKELVQNNNVLLNKHVTDVIYIDNLINAKYNEYREDEHLVKPIDGEIIELMAPYENIIMWNLERTAGRERNKQWRMYLSHLSFWNNYLDEKKINLVVGQVIPHMGPDLIIYFLCKIKKICYVCSDIVSYPNRFYMCDDIFDPIRGFDLYYKSLCEEYKKIDIGDIELLPHINEMYKFYTEKKDRRPIYMKKQNEFYRHKKKYFEAVFRRFQVLLRLGIHIFDTKPYIINFFEKKSNGNDFYREYECIYSFYKSQAVIADFSKKYIYVALHYQPEATTSPQAGIFVDQLLIIQMLSYWLPKGWYLYVKEHPSQLIDKNIRSCSFKSLDFFLSLSKIDNVKLICLEVSTENLIKNSVAVASATGTVGLEAITIGKPFLMFGFSYLQYAPNVYPIRTNEDCEKAMENLQSNLKKSDFEYGKKIKLYFKALEKYLFEGTVMYDDPVMIATKESIKFSKNNLINQYYYQITKCLE